MATLHQIRAARALLGWTQAELARAAKLSLAAVNNLERDASNPRLRTLAQIQSALESHGVEFQNGPGVRLRSEVFSTTTFDTGDVYAQLFKDILHTCVTQASASACYMNVKDTDFIGNSPESFKQSARDLRRLGLHERVLVEEGDSNLMFPPDTTHYRWLPKSFFGVSPFVVYGTKMAILLWGPPARAIVIESPSVAASYARQFEFFWQQSIDPPYSQQQLRDISQKLLPLD
ncbi:MAG: XRE family transcriptional regulator [Alphaproteobacteria bacterium]|nr:XRE family transcriptional regulator [Alphaproteobacteria bacterium]